MRTKSCLGALLLIASASCAFAAITPVGPDYPAPGGNSASGSGSAGGVGGLTWNYSGFDVTGLTNLWQGLASPSFPTAGLDGLAHLLTFSGVSGATATWAGTTGWTNPTTSVHSPAVPIKLDIEITAGSPTWTTLPIGGYTFPAIGAVIDNSAGADYSINLLFSADVGAGYVPINTIMQLSSPPGLTNSSVSLGFYSVEVPEPSALMVWGVGLIGAATYRVRKRRRS